MSVKEEYVRADGALVTVFEDGSQVEQLPNGTAKKTYADGKIETIDRRGNLELKTPDGTIVRRLVTGIREVITPRGVVEMHFPCGTTLIRLPDGTLIERYLQGEIITSPDLKVLMTQSAIDHFRKTLH